MTRSSEADIAAWVRTWRKAPTCSDGELRRAMAEWLSARLRAPEHADRQLAGLDVPPSVIDDPHALGWLHQYLGESARDDAFAQHTRRESKHTSQTATTQVYTPRWVADWLAERAIQSPEQTVLDPACGGGQMLLAAVDRLIELGAAPIEAFRQVRGVDLDPEATFTCRETLKLHARRLAGADGVDAVGDDIGRHVITADALFDDVEPADVVLTNPPYMGLRSMPAPLKEALRDVRPFHLDLYLAFVRRCADLADRSAGVLAQQTIWYLKRFEKARRWMLERGQLTDFAHLGHGVFDALTGEKATVVAFVWWPVPDDDPEADSGSEAHGERTRFVDLRGADDKPAALASTDAVFFDVGRFEALPATPLAFWLPERLLVAFEEGLRVGDVADVPGSQNKTGKNATYVRSIDDVDADDPRWVPYSKGGRFAPWWGNWDWVVDWSDEARAFYAGNRTSNLLPERYWFREGLCYSDFGGSHFNARWMPPGCIFDMAGPAVFVDGDDRDLLAALLVVLNSSVSRLVLNALNPTLHFQVRDVRNLPLPTWTDTTIAQFAELGHRLVDATRSALDGAATVEDLVRLEIAADQAVAEAYGCPDVVTRDGRRMHHRLPLGGD